MNGVILSRLPRMPPVEIIRSRSNPLVRRLRGLKEKSDDELCLVEGPKLLAEALHAGVLRSSRSRPRRGGREPSEPAAARRASGTRPADQVARGRASSIPSPRRRRARGFSPWRDGPASTRAHSRPSTAPRSWWSRSASRTPATWAGSCAPRRRRGRRAPILTEGTADPFSWKALRGSMGSAFRLPHLRGGDPEATLVTPARGRGSGSSPPSPMAAPTMRARSSTGRVALVFGSEGPGLPAELLRLADERVTIPLRPPSRA